MNRFRPGGARGRRDAGQAATDYLGVLVVVVTVVALVAGVLTAAGGSPIATSIGNAICSITGIGCGDAGSGTGTGASGTGTGTAPPAADAGDSDDSCSGFWGCTWSGIKTGGKFIGSLGYNVGKGVVDDVKGIYDLVTDPGSLIDAGKYLFTHPLDALKQLVWDDETQKMADDGDWGGVIGRELWNIGSLFIPGVDIAKVGAKVGAVGRIAARLAELAKLGDKAAEAAKVAKAAALRGDGAAAEAAAKEARKAADDAAAKAREAGCPIAAGIPRQRQGQLVLALADTQPRGPGLFSAPMPLAASAPVAVGGVGMLASTCGDAGDAARKADADADAAEKAVQDAKNALNGGLGELVPVAAKDPAADALAKRLGGQPSVRFSNGPQNEFDAVSDLYVAQSKPANFQLGQAFRNQAKTTFEVAKQSGRTPYFHFEGPPSPQVLQALQRYADRYGIEPVIDTVPFGG